MGVDFVGAPDVFAAGECGGVLVPCAGFGREEVVVSVSLVQVGAFYQIQLCAFEYRFPRADQLPCLLIPLLHADSREGPRPPPVVLQHVHEPLLAVVVVEQTGIEARRIDIVRVTPWSLDLIRGHDVVRCILEAPVLPLHIRVHEVELLPIMRQAGGPDAARVRVTPHVELRLPVKRPSDERPVGEIARVVDLHAGKPFECRGRDVVVFSDAEDGRVGVEAWEDGIEDLRHFGGWFGRGELREGTVCVRNHGMDGLAGLLCIVRWWRRA